MDEKTAKYMERIHDANFEMLCEVDRICKKYNIAYCLHGGTLLGAVRHQDFIPWDDDVDISFVRAEYERFLSVFEREAPSHLKLLKFEGYPKFFDFMVKIANTSLTYKATSFGEDAFYEGRFLHPTLDLFVFDIKKNDFQLTKLKLLYALSLGHRPYVNYRHFKGAMKAAAFVLSSLGKLIPMKRLAKRYIKAQTEGGVLELSKGAGSGLTEELPVIFISNQVMDPRYWGLSFYGPHILEGSETGIIRGKEFPIPRRYDEMLTRTYGDYRSLPPENQRHPQHVYDIAEQ